MKEPFRQASVIRLSNQLAGSYNYLTGKIIIDTTPETLADALYNAPFALVAHGVQEDPLFCYANQKAQDLWQMDWKEFIGMPSRLSAEEDEQDARNALLTQAHEHGYVDNYAGIRVTGEGRRFRISNCQLWNIGNEDGLLIGQAACFNEWKFL